MRVTISECIVDLRKHKLIKRVKQTSFCFKTNHELVINSIVMKIEKHGSGQEYKIQCKRRTCSSDGIVNLITFLTTTSHRNGSQLLL